MLTAVTVHRWVIRVDLTTSQYEHNSDWQAGVLLLGEQLPKGFITLKATPRPPDVTVQDAESRQ